MILSDHIARLIEEMLEEGGGSAEVRRNDLAARIGCPKSAIPDGCVYEDGGFCLVSEAIATGGKTAFDFTLGGHRFRGEHTGVLLWRDGKVIYATPGWKLEEQELKRLNR